MSIGDHELHAREPAVGEVAEELGETRLVLRVTDVDPDDLTVPVPTHGGSDHHGLGHDPPVLPHLQVGRVKPQVDERDAVQTALPQLCDVLIDVGTDPRHGRLRHARVAPQRLDEVIDLPGRRAGDVGGHDLRPQGPANPAARLEELTEVAALAQLRHPDLDVARRDRQQLGTVTVALDRAGRGPPARLRTDPGGQLHLESIRRAAPRLSPIDDAGAPSTSHSRRASNVRAQSCWATVRLLVDSKLRESHGCPPHFKRPAAKPSDTTRQNSPSLRPPNMMGILENPIILCHLQAVVHYTAGHELAASAADFWRNSCGQKAFDCELAVEQIFNSKDC